MNDEHETTTYDLRSEDGRSDLFYDGLIAFVSRFLEGTPPTCDREIASYMAWAGAAGREKVRGAGEYQFDLLLAGVLFALYGGAAERLPGPAAGFLTGLYRLRSKNTLLKRGSDWLRGVLSTLLLQRGPRGHAATVTEIGEKPTLGPGSAVKLQKLWRWARATGDLAAEAKRIAMVVEYSRSLSFRRRLTLYATIEEVTARFLIEQGQFFAPYLANVAPYRARALRRNRWREDYFLTTRTEVEYALSLFGAEVMNRDMSDGFRPTGRRTVLLPACMRRHPDRCRGIAYQSHTLCTGCDAGCSVNRLRKRGLEAGFSVLVVPHSSQASKWVKDWARGASIGVVGVACPLHLIGGGLELREQGIRAQCVFLDRCGCRAHWHPRGVPTDLNTRRLVEVAGR